MGRVYRRGKVWWIDYRQQGRRLREPVGPSKAAASRALAKRQVEIIEGRFFPKKKRSCITVREMIRLFWDLYAKDKRGHAHRPILKRLDKEFGVLPLDSVTVPMVLRYRNQVRDESSIANANRHHDVFRSLFNRAIEWGKFMGENPVAKVKQEKEKNRRLRFLSHDEIRRLLAACHSRLMPVVACALLTGMRKGEILNLRWENVSLEQSIIYILETESGEAREIPIAPTLREILLSLPNRGSGSVFDVAEITVRRYFAQALRAAGIEGFRFHDLRHTFASHYIMKTGDLPSLQKLLGHHSPAMTQRYAHLSRGHLRMGIQLLDSGMAVDAPNLGPVPPPGPSAGPEKAL
ncbi:MAG: site-specific integrase [Elusimicrobiota bacterium]